MDDDSPLWFKFSQCNCEEIRTTHSYRLTAPDLSFQIRWYNEVGQLLANHEASCLVGRLHGCRSGTAGFRSHM
jgi:hypothetical protein